VKVKVIPVIMVTNGNLRSFQRYLEYFPRATLQRGITESGHSGNSTHFGEDTKVALHLVSDIRVYSPLNYYVRSLRNKVSPLHLDRIACNIQRKYQEVLGRINRLLFFDTTRTA
jgi:hypothetical protein